MENKEDMLMRDFFGKNREEIPDNGFSDLVIRRLPGKKRKTNWIVPVFALIGTVISLFVIDIHEVVLRAVELVAGIPFVYLLAGFMIFPITILFLYYFCEKERAF